MPLLAAQTPSYRFRSRSVMLSRQRLRLPSWCLLGAFLKPRWAWYFLRLVSESESLSCGARRVWRKPGLPGEGVREAWKGGWRGLECRWMRGGLLGEGARVEARVEATMALAREEAVSWGVRVVG